MTTMKVPLQYPKELCDGVDNNCNGDIDESVTTQYFEDQDEDGYGNPDFSIETCSLPVGYVDNDSDCDDQSSSTNPDADEYCDNIDNNCDGFVDIFDVIDGNTYFQDSDSDGFGSPDAIIQSLYAKSWICRK